MTEANEPVKRRHWWWWLAIVPIIVSVLVVLIIAFLPHILTPERIRTEAVSALTELLGAQVQIDHLDYHPLTGVELVELTIGPPPGFTEDVLTVERATVHYRLDGILGRRITVSKIEVVAPIFTLETREGRTNLDVLLANLSGPSTVESAPDSAPSVGPLLPIDVDLTSLEIAPVTLVLAGDGPHARIEHARLRLDGQAGRERLFLKLLIALDPDEADNLTLHLDDAGIAARSTFALSLEVEGDTTRGLALERVALEIEAENRVSATWRDRPIDPATLAIAVAAKVEPSADVAKVERLQVELDGEPIVRARGEVDGISAAIGALAGEALAAALGASIGLVDRDRTGSVDLSIDRLTLPLDRFERWARLFLPEVAMAGTVELAPLELRGTARELADGFPSRLRLGLTLSGVEASIPSAGLKIDGLGGSITGAKRDEGGYRFDGALQVGPIAQARNRIGSTELELFALVDRLSHPRTGQTEAKVKVGFTGVVAPPARVNRGELIVSLAGLDPLAGERGADPVRVHAELSAGSTRIVQSATTSIGLSNVKLRLDAAIDRLLQPAIEPIDAKLTLTVGRASLGSDRTIERAALDLGAKIGDPRHGHFDADAELTLAVASAAVLPVKVRDAAIRLVLGAEDVRAREVRGFPGAPPPMMPRRIDLSLAVESPSVEVNDEELGDVATRFSLETSLSADPVAATVNVRKLALEMREVAKLLVKGRAARLYGGRPWIDGELELGPVHLDRLAAKIPRGLLKEVPDLRAEGKVSLSVRAKGIVPARFEKTSLVEQPIAATARIALEGAGVSSVKQSIRLSDLNGAIVAEVGGGRVETRTELEAAEIVQGRPPLENRIEKLTVKNEVRLEEDVWTVGSHVRAASVRSAFGGDGAVEGASIDLDLTYPQHGDLDLARFAVHAPGNGVELAMSGRLRRRAFGVFRPDLTVSGDFDLDRLRHLLPQLAGGRGKASVALTVTTRSDRVVDVEGSLEADRFSWEVPKVLTVLNASGRIPLSQRLSLPAPDLDVEVASAVGSLGDDFEARASEMVDDFLRAKALLDSEDILIEAPRSADYQSLRPYYASSGARMTIEGIVYGRHVIEDVMLEGLWSSGVLRIDRLACRLWEGDVLGDLAVQFTPDQNVRVRLRGTITDLNVDLPYAMANGIEPVTDEDDKEVYRVSGQADLEFSLKQRAVNARVDLTKVQLPLLRRAFGAMLLTDSPAMNALEIAETWGGVRPTSGKIWISNNLLNVDFDWERLWGQLVVDQESILGTVLDVFLVVPRFALIPTLGGYVTKTVNESIRNFSISALLDDLIGKARVEDQLRFLEGRVIAADRVQGGASGLPNAASADMLFPR